MSGYEKIKNGHRLSTTTVDLLHLMNEFEKLHKIKDQVTVRLVDDQLQKIETDTCGIFQFFFYVNLFMPVDSSTIINDKTLSKLTPEKLMNKIFSVDRDKNERMIEQFAEEHEMSKGE